jgi:hypothetical protein
MWRFGSRPLLGAHGHACRASGRSAGIFEADEDSIAGGIERHHAGACHKHSKRWCGSAIDLRGHAGARRRKAFASGRICLAQEHSDRRIPSSGIGKSRDAGPHSDVDGCDGEDSRAPGTFTIPSLLSVAANATMSGGGFEERTTAARYSRQKWVLPGRCLNRPGFPGGSRS